MKKVLIILSVLSFLSALAIISPWKAIGDKILGIVGLSASSPVSISATSEDGELKVFINDKEEGVTPFEKNNLVPGKYKVKLTKVTDEEAFYTTFERVFDVEEGTQVVINWDLGPSEDFSSGEIYFFKRNKGISNESSVSIIPYPEDSTVYFDAAVQSGPPYVTEGVIEGKHKVKIEKDHYIESEVDVQTRKGFDLFLEVRLFPLPIEVESL